MVTFRPHELPLRQAKTLHTLPTWGLMQTYLGVCTSAQGHTGEMHLTAEAAIGTGTLGNNWVAFGFESQARPVQ